jgi:hypothetical protein
LLLQQQQQQQQDKKQNKILNNLQFLHSGSFASNLHTQFAMVTKEFDQTKFDPTSSILPGSLFRFFEV